MRKIVRMIEMMEIIITTARTIGVRSLIHGTPPKRYPRIRPVTVSIWHP
jgi:hypothetical protein